MKIISNKKIINILNRVSANHVICADALSRADMSVENYSDAIEHLTDNTISIAISLYGESGMEYVSKVINKNK